MSVENTAGRGTFAGLFLVALATLMYEILLTRIFSVTMWYHFAFVAISIALFGMTLGAGLSVSVAILIEWSAGAIGDMGVSVWGIYCS